MQHLLGTYYLIFIACMISLGIGIFLFAVSVAKITKTILNEINNISKTGGNQQQALELLADYTQIHSDSKKYSEAAFTEA